MESVKKLNSNRLQHLIMFVLILILALIIGVYVYYGIQVAERSNQEQQVNIVEATPTSPDAERQKIIEDLAKPSPNNLTEEEKISVTNALEIESANTNTASETEAIINALNSNR